MGGLSVVVSGGTLWRAGVRGPGECVPGVSARGELRGAGVWPRAPLTVPSLSAPTSSSSGGGGGSATRGLITLWLEHDADTPQAKEQRVGLMGLYQEAPGYRSYSPGASLSFKRQLVGRTVRSTSEVAAKGDDKLEQELLARRTSFYACSKPRSRAFDTSKVSDEDRAAALALYDRYYPDMKSFLEPDAEGMGAEPDLPCQSDSVVLVQDARPVSEFVLPDDEQIIAMQYCTLPVEKISQSTYFKPAPAAAWCPK